MKKKAGETGVKKAIPLESQFAEVSSMILSARQKAFRAVDVTLVELYWNIGAYISERVARAKWGDGTVVKLAEYLGKAVPDSREFNRRGLYRMKQFYEAYDGDEKVPAMPTQISWTNHLLILSKAKSAEERLFYLSYAIKECCATRELERQIKSGLFERNPLSKPKVSPVVTQIHPGISNILRDSYSLDFLGLHGGHSEADLRKAWCIRGSEEKDGWSGKR